jgi:RND family efflux transporter MFP subunit
LLFFNACQPKQHSINHTNEHNSVEETEHLNVDASDLHNHVHEKAYLTTFSAEYEIFIEHDALVLNEPSEFIVHITKLADYKPIKADEINLYFEADKSIVLHFHSHQAGIFHGNFTPSQNGNLILKAQFIDADKKVNTPIDTLTVFASDGQFTHNAEHEADLITFLKEQAWKDAFALHRVKNEAFSKVIKTSGELLPAPGDETIITALHSGTISLRNKLMEGRKVEHNEIVSTISSDLIHQNLTNDYLLARNSFEKAKLDFERTQKLINEKLISEKEYLESKLNYESAKNSFNNISKFYSNGNENVKAPCAGIIRSVFVSEGQFIQEGTPIATLMQNKRVVLKANVPQQYNHLTPGIYEANFKPVYASKIFNTRELNGKRISYSSALSANSMFTTVNFEFDAIPEIIPGSYSEVYLKSTSAKNTLTIPFSALMEDQGNYFVFVMADGEHYRKTYIKTGDNDGKNVEVVWGLKPGDYVVSTGTYRVFLASLGNAAPTHSHSH